MSEVKTYCPTWRASVGSTMMEYALRDSQPELYVDYHDYKALEAENTQLRTENARLISALNKVAWVLHDQHDEFEALTIAHDVLDALTQREGGEE